MTLATVLVSVHEPPTRPGWTYQKVLLVSIDDDEEVSGISSISLVPTRLGVRKGDAVYNSGVGDMLPISLPSEEVVDGRILTENALASSSSTRKKDAGTRTGIEVDDSGIPIIWMQSSIVVDDVYLIVGIADMGAKSRMENII
ncbi:uncharacterized protein FSUBG_7971 [Fusarium subglutinans]|uniref:Uncharacterized protein n=1 Tax=Gibberella subglutinans TaxID=42677 RepID=A0A8H5PSF3_GIBSU|nr:uncharacterized protein FSUBG_7971 [Fusarium subglutinans]KAF5601799.1 hypothetical protein FSUBG_7971 [Fusarium subglutinans]